MRRQPVLVALAGVVGLWQMCHHAAMVVQILFATHTLGLSAQAVGLACVALGVGTVAASVFGHRLSRRVCPGPCLVLGIATCGAGWLAVAAMPAGAWGVAAFAAMLLLSGVGAVLLALWAARCPVIRGLRELPRPGHEHELAALGFGASVRRATLEPT